MVAKEVTTDSSLPENVLSIVKVVSPANIFHLAIKHSKTYDVFLNVHSFILPWLPRTTHFTKPKRNI